MKSSPPIVDTIVDTMFFLSSKNLERVNGLDADPRDSFSMLFYPSYVGQEGGSASAYGILDFIRAVDVCNFKQVCSVPGDWPNGL